MSTIYYNEIEPYCVQWLRNLMDADLIPRGDIDTRSIEDVIPNELRGYTQCHFFAGLGGWPFALALAGWSSSWPIWTGSCPCQPFSAAGKGAGFADERHLWPSWQHLISQCRPATLFGEQVASASQWLGLVCGDLEGMGYAVGFNHIEAASAGADHRRDRLWFVADANSSAGYKSHSLTGRRTEGSRAEQIAGFKCASDGTLAYTDQSCASQERQQRSGQFSGAGSDTESRDSWIVGHDGKARRVKSGLRLLVDGLPARVGKLRALGNAIDPRPAAAFVRAYMEARGLSADQKELIA